MHPLPPHPDVIVPGLIDEAAKWGLLRGATTLVSPSANESFSLVVLEAWVAGVPVVVNGRCAVTREHCERSGGGFWFDGYAQFEAVIDRLVADADLRADAGRAGRGVRGALLPLAGAGRPLPGLPRAHRVARDERANLTPKPVNLSP